MTMEMLRLPAHATPFDRLWHVLFLGLCGGFLLFLIAPILVIVPLSFNAHAYFSFSEGMLTLDPAAYSFRWYRAVAGSDIWRDAILNSVAIAAVSTAIATLLGTLAALGLARADLPGRNTIMALLISPLIVPLIITGAGIYFVYAKLGLVGSFAGVVLAHAALGAPFVVITVTATLAGFDRSLSRAGASLGGNPVTVFRRITAPLILPGIASGAVFAFGNSFDEIIVVLFIGSVHQQTVPRQMWSGLREELSPAILAVATILVAMSVLLLIAVELLKRRSARLRGAT